LYVREKKATSDPAIRKEIVNNKMAMKMSTAEAAGVINSKEKCKDVAKLITE
jgi:hypothetical protein